MLYLAPQINHFDLFSIFLENCKIQFYELLLKTLLIKRSSLIQNSRTNNYQITGRHWYNKVLYRLRHGFGTCKCEFSNYLHYFLL